MLNQGVEVEPTFADVHGDRALWLIQDIGADVHLKWDTRVESTVVEERVLSHDGLKVV
jgi:hypothetical protein